LQENEINKYTEIINKLINNTQKQLTDYSFGDVSNAVVIDSQENEVDKAKINNDNTVMKGLLAVGMAAGIDMAINAGFDNFVYDGPDDEKTRPFCHDILAMDKNWTVDEIVNLDNGQGLPVLTNMGGYNCRHVWTAVE
jgi:hypothetical protein